VPAEAAAACTVWQPQRQFAPGQFVHWQAVVALVVFMANLLRVEKHRIRMGMPWKEFCSARAFAA
jgi:hypothetical protein